MVADLPGRTHDGRIIGSFDAPLPHLRDEWRKLPLPRVDESKEEKELTVGPGGDPRGRAAGGGAVTPVGLRPPSVTAPPPALQIPTFPYPRWVPSPRRCGSLLRADYQSVASVVISWVTLKVKLRSEANC